MHRRQNLIDDVHKLMDASEDELNDILLSNKYNKPLLRELVRRSLKVANEYKNALDYEKNHRKKTEEFLKRYE